MMFLYVVTKLFSYIWSYWVHTLFIMRVEYMHWDITDKVIIEILYILFTDCYYTNYSFTDCYYCFLWLTYNNIMIILYHWNSRPLLHTIKLVYRNNHYLDKHYVKLK